MNLQARLYRLERQHNEILKGLSGSDHCKYESYQDDPVGFGEQVLIETYTNDVKRMMESVRDHPVTVAKSANATGKTHGAARVAAWWYLSYPDCQVYTAAAPPESNLKKLLWGEIGTIVEKHPEVFKSETVKNLHISRGAQTFLSGVTIPSSGSEAQREAKFSGKHSPHLLFIIDEGDAVPDEVYRGIESCMSGGHARLLIMLNPRAEAGEPYRMERDGRANVVHLSAFSHPNVVTGEDHIPGAVTRETTVRRINQWCRPLAAGEPKDNECFDMPEFLVGATAEDQSGVELPPLKAGHYKVMDPAMFYMVLGRYPSQASNQLISREWINRARSRWDAYVQERGEVPPKGIRPIMGLDVAEFGTDVNFACFRYGGYVEKPTHETTWSGLDPLQTGDRASQQFKQRRAYKCNVDATGVGSGVAPQMRRNQCRANAVKVAEKATFKTEIGEFRRLRDQLWWEAREWLRADPGAMLPPDEMMIEELLVATYEVRDGKIKVMSSDTMKELLKRSPDKAVGLTMTFAPEGFLGGCDLS